MAANASALDESLRVSTADIVIGAPARPSEAGRWLLRQTGDGFIVACNDQDCGGDLIDIAVTRNAGGECSVAMLAGRVAAAHPRAFDARMVTIVRPGMAIRAALIDMGVAT
jgi:hypothetical protein